jgi:hypothetical protein
MDRENKYSCPICQLSNYTLKTHDKFWTHIIINHDKLIDEKAMKTCCTFQVVFDISVDYHKKNGLVLGSKCDCPFCFDIENFKHLCDKSSFPITKMYKATMLSII